MDVHPTKMDIGFEPSPYEQELQHDSTLQFATLVHVKGWPDGGL